jgi:hypothetical protein
MPSEAAHHAALRTSRYGLLATLEDPQAKPVLDTVVQALRSGNYLDTCASLAGVHPDTLKQWLKRGAQDPTGQTPEGRLWARIAAAMSEAEAIDVARMNRAAQKDWRAAAWVLERRWPERWSLKLQATVAPAVAAPDASGWNLQVLNLGQLMALLEIARQAAGADQAAALAGAVNGNGHGHD